MESIKIDKTVRQPIEKVWNYYTQPSHIINWNFAHESWHCPKAKNNLQVNGKLECRMEAKDQSFGFEFVGIYDEIILNKKIKYHLEDGRKVEIIFQSPNSQETKIEIIFDPESINPIEMQKEGWQAILDNFCHYAETH